MYSFMLHRGEEPPVSGSRGSGTVFFGGCSLSCAYCQNAHFSQVGQQGAGGEAGEGAGGGPGGGRDGGGRGGGADGGGEADADIAEVVGPERVAAAMLALQKEGAHNINAVTAAHLVPGFLGALAIAAARGLSVPLVWNTSGYETEEALALLDGVVDVYLADARYGRDADAERLSGAPDYVAVNRAALREMLRQVGHLRVDERGIATGGLIVRHLVLPGGAAGSGEVAERLAADLGPGLFAGVMGQFIPAHRSARVGLGRRVTQAEYDDALGAFWDRGLRHGWAQSPEDTASDGYMAGTEIKRRRCPRLLPADGGG